MSSKHHMLSIQQRDCSLRIIRRKLCATTAATCRAQTETTISTPKPPSLLDRLHQQWYDRSGTTEILHLKQEVSRTSAAFDAAQDGLVQARLHLDTTLRFWEQSNGQHVQLLQRRETWTPADAQEFATVIQQEVESRQALEEARLALNRAEKKLSDCQLQYMNAMRKRYHEEQIWQDQWRVLSTYGTWSLIILNSLVFLASQYLHNARETAKLKTMETLILETLPRRVGQDNDSGKESYFKDEEDAFIEESANSLENDDGALNGDRATNGTDSNTQQEEDTTSKDDSLITLMEENNTQEAHQVPDWSRMAHNKLTVWAAKSEVVIREIHVPSLILGASVAGVAFLVSAAVTQRR